MKHEDEAFRYLLPMFSIQRHGVGFGGNERTRYPYMAARIFLLVMHNLGDSVRFGFCVTGN
jgi:hypothetical protein